MRVWVWVWVTPRWFNGSSSSLIWTRTRPGMCLDAFCAVASESDSLEQNHPEQTSFLVLLASKLETKVNCVMRCPSFFKCEVRLCQRSAAGWEIYCRWQSNTLPCQSFLPHPSRKFLPQDCRPCPE